jgi:signal transduction histidine kinase
VRFFSLEKKLPILIGSLVAIALVAALLLVRYELRQAALGTAGERLSDIALQLDGWVENSLASRAQVVRAVADDPVLADYATARNDDVVAVRSVLQRLRTAADSGMPVQLRALDGSLLVSADTVTGSVTRGDGRAPAAPPEIVLTTAVDSLTWGGIFVQGGSAVYWTAAPVRDGSTVVAQLVQQRRIGNRAVGEQLEQLIGGRAEIYFANSSGGPWSSLDGSYISDAPVPEIGRVFRYEASTGDGFLASAVGVAGTPWVVVARMPEDAVFGRTSDVVRRLAAVLAALLLLGLVAAWLISRSVTVPLRRLAAGADAMAHGDYSHRTGLNRDDEIGRLAHSFDAMAERVQTSHAEIGRRFEQAQMLAAELEQTNTRLQDAIHEADLASTEAMEASRAKSEFLATISHEIRTPINAVVGYTDLMDMELPGPLTEQQREYVARIRLSGEHLISLVNDVLDFAKIESGQMRVQREARRIGPDLEAAAAMLDATARAKRISLVVRSGPRLSYLGDSQRVQQIVLNLLSNALKFTEEGGRVELSADQRQSRAVGESEASSTWTCVAVADTGVGIPHDMHEQIFQPFEQGAAGYTRTHGGAGLGLAISRSLARMMGGDITVESEPGRGSTFTLWLPQA